MNRLKSIDNLRIKLWSVWLIGAALWAIICACLVLINTFRTAPEPLKYEIIEFSVCKGWNNDGVLIRQTAFFTDEKSIIACGQLQTNHPITLSIDWYYEGKLIHTDIIHGVENQFLSELNPPEDRFLEGSYELQLVIGKKTIQSIEFEVLPRMENSE